MKKISIAYFGTPEFSARFLKKLFDDKEIPVEVKLVVTQPDKKVGRKQILTPSAVKSVVNSSVTLFDERIEPSKLTPLLKDVDLAVLFAYGEIIGKDLLEAPKYGFWNIHPSLLPQYRGASPVAAPIMAGDAQTGVTLMQMDAEVDHGPIIAQEMVEILPKEKRDALTYRLVDLGYELFKQKVGELAAGSSVSGTEQNHSLATFTKMLKKQDGFVEFEELKDGGEDVFNRFRGLYPWPGIWTEVMINGEKKRLKITDMDLVDGKIVLKKVQLEGKTEVDFETFKKAYDSFKASL